MIDIVEILIHWYAGRSQHELAASLGVDRKTLRKYTAPRGTYKKIMTGCDPARAGPAHAGEGFNPHPAR